MGASLQLPGGLKTLNPQPEISRYYNESGSPYIDTAQVISQIIPVARYVGQTFLVGTQEFWFNPSVNNIDLKLKQAANTVIGTGTANYLARWVDANNLTAGQLYDNGSVVLLGSNVDNGSGSIFQVTGVASFTDKVVILSGGLPDKLIVGGNGKFAGSVQLGNNTEAASADNVGAVRYREDETGSFVDMVMKVSLGVYSWINIVKLLNNP